MQNPVSQHSVWKVIYEFDERYYVDAVRVGYRPTAYEGVL